MPKLISLPTLNVGDRVAVKIPFWHESRPGVIMIIERTLQQYYVELDNGRVWACRSEIVLIKEAQDERH